jgi:hypothetical protein
MVGITHPQHQSRGAGSCMGRKPPNHPSAPASALSGRMTETGHTALAPTRPSRSARCMSAVGKVDNGGGTVCHGDSHYDIWLPRLDPPPRFRIDTVETGAAINAWRLASARPLWGRPLDVCAAGCPPVLGRFYRSTRCVQTVVCRRGRVFAACRPPSARGQPGRGGRSRVPAQGAVVWRSQGLLSALKAADPGARAADRAA